MSGSGVAGWRMESPPRFGSLVVETRNTTINTITPEDAIMNLGELTLEEAAKEVAGTWRRFHCFAWSRSRDLEDPQDWCIVYTHHRDSTLLDLSNSEVIEKTLEPFSDSDDPNVIPEHHSHWAVGWIDGYSIRVFRNSEITSAFRIYHEIAVRLANCPILNEEDYSDRETEATLANLTDAAWRLQSDYELPQDWETDVYQWLSDHDPSAVENTDDQGGYPDEDQLRAAFEALAYRQIVGV